MSTAAAKINATIQHHVDCANLSKMVYGVDPIDAKYGTTFNIPLDEVAGASQRGLVHCPTAGDGHVVFEGTRQAEAWNYNVNSKQIAAHITAKGAEKGAKKAKNEALQDAHGRFGDWVKKRDVKMHPGFFNALQGCLGDLWPTVKGWLDSISQWKKGDNEARRVLRITGHSKGAGLGTVFAAYVLGKIHGDGLENKVAVELVTFGSPRVLCKNGCDLLEEHLAAHRRYVNVLSTLHAFHDVVSLVPIEQMGYAHVGPTIRLRCTPTVELDVNELASKELFDNVDTSFNAAGKGTLEVHQMATYKAGLEAELKQPGSVELPAKQDAFESAKQQMKSAFTIFAGMADGSKVTEQHAKLVQEVSDETKHADAKAAVEATRKMAAEMKASWCYPLETTLPLLNADRKICEQNLNARKAAVVERIHTLRDVARLGAVAMQGAALVNLIHKFQVLKGEVKVNADELGRIEMELDKCRDETNKLLLKYTNNKTDTTLSADVDAIEVRVEQCFTDLDDVEYEIAGTHNTLRDLKQRAFAEAATNAADSIANSRKVGGTFGFCLAACSAMFAIASVGLAVHTSSKLEDEIERQLDKVGSLRAYAREILEDLKKMKASSAGETEEQEE